MRLEVAWRRGWAWHGSTGRGSIGTLVCLEKGPGPGAKGASFVESEAGHNGDCVGGHAGERNGWVLVGGCVRFQELYARCFVVLNIGFRGVVARFGFGVGCAGWSVRGGFDGGARSGCLRVAGLRLRTQPRSMIEIEGCPACPLRLFSHSGQACPRTMEAIVRRRSSSGCAEPHGPHDEYSLPESVQPTSIQAPSTSRSRGLWRGIPG